MDEKDLEALAAQGPELSDVVTDTRGLGTSRLIYQNVTETQAQQINGPIGKDIWEKVNHLEVKGNKASGDSQQINYANSIEGYGAIMNERRADRDAASRRMLAEKRAESNDRMVQVLMQVGVGVVITVCIAVLIKLFKS